MEQPIASRIARSHTTPSCSRGRRLIPLELPCGIRRLVAPLALVAAASVLALGWPTRAAAQIIQEFPPGSSELSSLPIAITAGPDGNLWFTERFGSCSAPLIAGCSKIARITTAGVITEFPVPTPGGGPIGITAGPDGALWFTEFDGQKIGRLQLLAGTPGGANRQ